MINTGYCIELVGQIFQFDICKLVLWIQVQVTVTVIVFCDWNMLELGYYYYAFHFISQISTVVIVHVFADIILNFRAIYPQNIFCLFTYFASWKW